MDLCNTTFEDLISLLNYLSRINFKLQSGLWSCVVADNAEKAGISFLKKDYQNTRASRKLPVLMLAIMNYGRASHHFQMQRDKRL